MFGICAYGAYIPAYRLVREQIALAHGGRSQKGERAVAGYDEDSLTMGAEAATSCLHNYAGSGLDHGNANSVITEQIKGLVFATTTSPLAEKPAASILSSLLGLSPHAYCGDLSGSLRGGISSIRLAQSLLQEPDDKVLVVTADMRLGEPGSESEQAFGDGAAAILWGHQDVLASLDGQFTVNANFPHFWRQADEPYVHAGETRFVEKYGYINLTTAAIKGLLESTGLAVQDIDKLIVYSPDGRSQQKVANGLGIDAQKLADTYFSQVGDTGTAQVYLTLIGALAEMRPGQRLVVAAYGDGAEAVLLTITERAADLGQVRGLTPWLNRCRTLSSYQKYLRFREVMGESSYVPFSSLALLWREEEQNLRLIAGRCRQCGAISFPRRRICEKCGTQDQFAKFPLARSGQVYTYTNDYVYLNPAPPLSQAVIDLDGGGRFFGQVTDVDPGTMKIGLRVELALRKLHDGQELPNYFWKIRPAVGRD